MKPNIGIIGAGFVGGAIARGFALYANVKIYDKSPERRCHSFEEVCESDYIFLCLPTPMERVDGGKADLSIIHSVCSQLQGATDAIIILKSTIPIGTTKKLAEQYGLKVVHNPEFLTARNADIDFITPARTIFGGPPEWTAPLREIFAKRFPGTNIMEMTSNESEAVKYVANCFFALKVIYFNEVYLGMKDAHDLDWDRVMEGVLTDGRIGVSHHQVPGFDGKFGFGGACFPKDICALIAQLEENGFDPKVLKAAWEQNKAVRPDLDWGRIPGAVSGNT
jgi:nucleotide sugar dehydrogenase